MQNKQKMKIKSYPRIHLTLIGMNDDGYRINGGIGFSISVPTMEIEFTVSNEISVIDKRKLKFTDIETQKLQNVLLQAKHELNLSSGLIVKIEEGALPHYGLGSNTAIYMSCVEALLLLNEIEYNHEMIVTLSHRGGTSGIGINTYFNGGFVLDLGIRNEQEILTSSSNADRNDKKPLVLTKCNLPNWKIGVCVPRFISNVSEQEEIDFFAKNCPLDKSYVTDILYESVYGITSSILEKDYNIFCISINNLQATKWKQLERSIYGEDLAVVEKRIRCLGVDCLGMSSLGPTLFFLGNQIDDITEILCKEMPQAICYVASFNNQGRIISDD